jgi:hypothetical protein
MVAVAAWVSGVLTLAGVVVGSIVSGGVQFYFARRHEKGGNRAAARLVDADLGRARAVIQQLLRPPPQFGSERAGEFELPAWEQQRGVLAVELSRPAWTAVRDGVAAVETFRRRLGDNEEERDDEELRKLAVAASAGIDEARKRLEPYLWAARLLERRNRPAAATTRRVP